MKYLATDETEHANADELEHEIMKQLRLAMESGDADGPAARELVEMHKRWLCIFWPTGMYEPSLYKNLADAYLSDPRFQDYYEAAGAGTTQFLRDAIHACA